MASVNLDNSPLPQLGIIGMQIAQQSQATLASVVTQALTATEEIASQSKANAGPGTGQHVDTIA